MRSSAVGTLKYLHYNLHTTPGSFSVIDRIAHFMHLFIPAVHLIVLHHISYPQCSHSSTGPLRMPYCRPIQDSPWCLWERCSSIGIKSFMAMKRLCIAPQLLSNVTITKCVCFLFTLKSGEQVATLQQEASRASSRQVVLGQGQKFSC